MNNNINYIKLFFVYFCVFSSIHLALMFAFAWLFTISLNINEQTVLISSIFLEAISAFILGIVVSFDKFYHYFSNIKFDRNILIFTIFIHFLIDLFHYTYEQHSVFTGLLMLGSVLAGHYLIRTLSPNPQITP